MLAYYSDKCCSHECYGIQYFSVSQTNERVATQRPGRHEPTTGSQETVDTHRVAAMHNKVVNSVSEKSSAADRSLNINFVTISVCHNLIPRKLNKRGEVSRQTSMLSNCFSGHKLGRRSLTILFAGSPFKKFENHCYKAYLLS